MDGSLRHVHALLSDYVDGELSNEQRQAIDEHLRGCPSCRSDLASLRLTVQLVRQLPARPVPRSFAIPVTRRSSSILTWLRWSTGTLAAIFVLMLAASYVLPRQAPSAAVAPAARAVPTSAPLAPALDTSARPAAPTSAPAPPVAAPTTAPIAAAGAPAGGSASAPLAAQSQASSANVPPGATPRPPAAASGPSQARAVALAPTETATPSASAAVPTATSPYPIESAPPPPAPTSSFTYPAATTVPAASVATSAATSAATPAPTSSAEPLPVGVGPTTWFTPALLIVGLLVIVSAIALILLGRRQ